MSTNSAIEWTDTTWNPVAGCSLVSPGCTHCYAMQMAARLEAMGQAKYAGLTKKINGHAVWTGKINLDTKALLAALSWKKPRRVFVNSMSDLFHEGVPFEFVDKVFAVMSLTPQHTYQVLTKRPERMTEYLNGYIRREVRGYWMGEFGIFASAILGGEVENEPQWFKDAFRKMKAFHYPDCPQPPKSMGDASLACPWPLPNVWLGTSVENQKAADKRISQLLKCPAAVRFLSCEPLLGPVDLRIGTTGVPTNEWGIPVGPCGYHCDERVGHVDHQNQTLDWVIVGGESGPGARPCNTDWVRSIVKQCAAADVACFAKQLGANVEWSGVQGGYGDGPSNVWPTKSKSEETTRGTWRRFLKDGKGGDPAEWPEDLRVRQFPAQKLEAPCP